MSFNNVIPWRVIRREYAAPEIVFADQPLTLAEVREFLGRNNADVCPVGPDCRQDECGWSWHVLEEALRRATETLELDV